MADNSEQICFVISPIGEPGSDIRKRSDQVLKYIIRPAVESCGYKVVRADEMAEPGIITNQIIRHVVDDPLVIADLTGQNPNVFYELAIRHATRKPLIQIINKVEDIPFDVGSMRTIEVDHRDLDSVEEAKAEIERQIQHLEANLTSLENPISVALAGRSIDGIKPLDQGHLDEKIKKIGDRTDEILRHLKAKTAVEEIEEVKQAVANVRENPRASPIDRAVALAVFFQQQGKRDEAIEKWRAVAQIAEDSDNDLAAKAWYSVGYLFRDENPEDCLLANNEAIRLKPDYAEAYNNRGNAKVALGQYAEAIADYDEAIRLKPDYAEAYYIRGFAKGALGQSAEAIVDFDEAIRLKPDYAEAYHFRGFAKGTLGQYAEAIVDCDEAIRLKPDLAEAYKDRGFAKVALGQHTEAIVDCDEAIRLKPDLAEAYYIRGFAKGALGQYAEAIVDFDEAIRLKPDYAEAYHFRGFAKGTLGQYAEAITDFDEAIRLKPSFAEAYNNRGIAKGALGLIEEARQDFGNARDLARDASNDSIADAAEQRLREFSDR